MGRDYGPAYKHFEKIKESVVPSYERYKCRYCATEYSRNHTKMLHHLKIQCKKVPQFVKQELIHISAIKSNDTNPSTSTSSTEIATGENLELSATMYRPSDVAMSSFLDSMSSKEQVS